MTLFLAHPFASGIPMAAHFSNLRSVCPHATCPIWWSVLLLASYNWVLPEPLLVDFFSCGIYHCSCLTMGVFGEGLCGHHPAPPIPRWLTGKRLFWRSIVFIFSQVWVLAGEGGEDIRALQGWERGREWGGDHLSLRKGPGDGEGPRQPPEVLIDPLEPEISLLITLCQLGEET